MMPNFVREYILLQSEEAKAHLATHEIGGFIPMVSCERYVVTNMDQNILSCFIGYFYERDQELMASSFPILSATKDTQTKPLKAEQKALPVRNSDIVNFEMS